MSNNHRVLTDSNGISDEMEFICQIQTVPQTGIVQGTWTASRYYRGRVMRFLKRRLNYAVNAINEITNRKQDLQDIIAPVVQDHLKSGDYVQVKSRREIQASLNRWNRLGGCGFMEEMWRYCGTTQQVLYPVNQFVDERDYQVKRCKNTVILDNVHCSGTIDFGPCDRHCFFFWREEWLERIENGESAHEQQPDQLHTFDLTIS